MADASSLLNLNDRYQSADSIGHLLSRARTMLAKSLDAMLAEYDITHAQGSILWLLSTGRFSTATDLARELYIDAASMTRMIDRLERRKLTVRMPRGDDRRVINLRLTPAGRILAEKLPEIYTSAMNRNFAGFSAEEVGQLHGLLTKLLANGTSGCGPVRH